MVTKLLELCGFEPSELEQELPRVNRAFDILGITAEDVDRAQQRIVAFYDIELRGMRKILGVYLRELINLVLAREEGKKKIIYASVPAVATEIIYTAVSCAEDVYATFPDILFDITLGSLFGKLAPILEAAEKLWLRADVAHCGLVKTRLGLLASGIIPRPDLLISLGQVCDEAPKSDELVHELRGIPVQYTNLCQDRSDSPDDFSSAWDFFTEQIKRCRERIEDEVGFKITDELIGQARDTRRGYNAAADKVGQLVLGSDPVPLNAACLMLVQFIPMIPFSPRNLQVATEGIETLYHELEQRVRQGQGIAPKGTPRVLLVVLPSVVDPSLTHMAESLGIVTPVFDFFPCAPDGDLKPPRISLAGVSRDRLAAYNYLVIGMTNCLSLRIRSLVGACRRFKLDGVWFNMHFSCRPHSGDVLIVKDAVERELGIPTLLIEAEQYDPRYYALQQMRTRIQAFSEILASR